jgi:hypothetical protein
LEVDSRTTCARLAFIVLLSLYYLGRVFRESMKRTFAGLLILLLLGQGTAVAAPLAYCFVAGDFCCDGTSRDACCQVTDAPGLTNCCGVASLLVARNTSYPSALQGPSFQLAVSGTIVTAPLLAAATPRTAARLNPLPLPPHLASVVLLI